MGLTELHEKPHLVIGYVAAGHKVVPPIGKTTGIPGRPRTPDRLPRKPEEDAPAGSELQSGYALPTFRPGGILILIVAALSP